MPITSNRVIESAQGEFIKILYMDDYFSDSKSLERINDALDDETEWLVTGCVHDYGGGAKKNPHYPKYTENISTGNNGIGGPSVLTIRNKEPLLFDTELSWLLDCDLYKRYHDKYGEPKILNDLNVVIGIHVGQVTNTMPDSDKQLEAKYVENKYA